MSCLEISQRSASWTSPVQTGEKKSSVYVFFILLCELLDSLLNQRQWLTRKMLTYCAEACRGRMVLKKYIWSWQKYSVFIYYFLKSHVYVQSSRYHIVLVRYLKIFCVIYCSFKGISIKPVAPFIHFICLCKLTLHLLLFSLDNIELIQ